jgi:hypothetical protein
MRQNFLTLVGVRAVLREAVKGIERFATWVLDLQRAIATRE